MKFVGSVHQHLDNWREIPISRFVRSVSVTEFSENCERSRMPKAMSPSPRKRGTREDR